MSKNKAISLFYRNKYSEVFSSFPVEPYEVDFFMPYSIYKITIDIDVDTPFKQKLDLFEEIVLKLLFERSMTGVELENTLCLDRGLIDSILMRLQNNGYIEADKTCISELGKDYCTGKSKSISSSRIVSEVRYIFKSLIDNGDKNEIYLPFVLTEIELKDILSTYLEEDLDESEELEELEELEKLDDTNEIKLVFGEKGSPYIIVGKKYGSIKRKSSKINKSEIRKLIQQYNKLQEGRFNSDINICDIDCEYYDSVWVHCKAVLTKQSHTVLLSEGCSEALYPMERYFPKDELSNLMIEINKNNKVKKETFKNTEKEDIEIKNPQYKDLEYLYLKILKYINSSKGTVNNYEEGRTFEGKHDRYIQNLYGAFEWLFYYYYKGKRISKKIKDAFDLSRSTSMNRIDLIKRISSNLGLTWKDTYKDLFTKCTSKTISSMITKVDTHLSIRLGLVILSSSQKESYEFRTLCRSYPDLLGLLSKLKKQRDTLSHTLESGYENEKFDDRIFDLLREAIVRLLPDFILTSSDYVKEDRKNEIMIRDYWLDELVLLEQFPAHYVKYIMTDNLKNSWALLLQNNEKFSNAERIALIYRNMQTTLELAIVRSKNNKEVSKESVLGKLCDEIKGSKVFETVNPNYIKNAFKKQSTSLGGAALVFLYCLKQNNLEGLHKILELGYIRTIEFIIDKRGHGNQRLLNVRDKDVEQVFKSWIDIVQVIGEL